jgi:hypothetical protein
MPKEVKTSGVKIETHVAPSLRQKFKRKAAKNNTSMKQILRDFIQKYVKE